jgi:hypothetical protein
MTSHIGFEARSAARCSRVVFAAAVLCGCFQSVALAAGPVGLWYAEGGAAEVEIRPCSDGLCGKIVWLGRLSAMMAASCAMTKIPIQQRAPGQSSASRFSGASDSLTRKEGNGREGRFTIRPEAGLTRATLGSTAMTDSFCEATSESNF